MWMTVLDYAVPALTAFGGAAFGSWLRGKHDREARRAEDLREARQELSEVLPILSDTVDALRRRAAEAKAHGDFESHLGVLWDGVTGGQDALDPFLARLEMLHTSPPVRRAATELRRELRTLHWRVLEAGHPENTVQAAYDHMDGALQRMKGATDELAAALRGDAPPDAEP